MANLAVLASGNGSNFQAIAERLSKTDHTLRCMICDRKKAYAFTRSESLGIKSYHVSYINRERTEAEKEIITILENENTDLIALAGFMKVFTPFFVNRYKNRIVNIHPSLLPKYPGTRGIEESYNSGDTELGVTIHYADTGVDTGRIIIQKSFTRTGAETIEEIEKKIHNLEYSLYPGIVETLLDTIDDKTAENDLHVKGGLI